ALAPFTVEGRWGVIAAAIPATATYGERELELLGGLAQQTKLALQSASSYETLERTFFSTVEALANALEANDEYTSSHTRWITDLALTGGAAFHAMAPDRPYRKALRTDEARRRLNEGAGSQFDPQVVTACLRVLGS